MDITLYLDRERTRPIWPLAPPPSSLYTVCEIAFYSEKWPLKTQMWVPCRFLLVQGTKNGIPISFVPKNSLFDHLLRYVVQ